MLLLYVLVGWVELCVGRVLWWRAREKGLDLILLCRSEGRKRERGKEGTGKKQEDGG